MIQPNGCSNTGKLIFCATNEDSGSLEASAVFLKSGLNHHSAPLEMTNKLGSVLDHPGLWIIMFFSPFDTVSTELARGCIIVWFIPLVCFFFDVHIQSFPYFCHGWTHPSHQLILHIPKMYCCKPDEVEAIQNLYDMLFARWPRALPAPWDFI